MLFNSPVYLFLFLPTAVVIYFSLNRFRLFALGKLWLVLCSLFFYGYWKPIYVLLILSSIVVNYAFGRALHKARNVKHLIGNRDSCGRTVTLIAGVVFNLGLLGYFKYADFFLANINWLINGKIPLLGLVLPLGISFFTFQQIAYLADCYQTDTKEYDFLNYCLFVAFFPQLIAGPIVHHGEIMPQFFNAENKRRDYHNVARGVFIFSVGLFKKVVVADSLSVWAHAGFDTGRALSVLEGWITSMSYTFQLYYDFSAYSDMAIGAALLLNIRLPVNFNSPYKALNIRDFWQRWHMTLARWLRDYLYIPLGGNRKSRARTLTNLWVIFILAGLWHGAGWTFVAWGCVHGVALTVHRIWRHFKIKIPKLLAWLLTFLFINISWVFFRAENFSGAIRVLKGMAGLNGFQMPQWETGGMSWLTQLPLYRIGGVAFTGADMTSAVLLIAAFALAAFVLPNAVQMIGFVPYSGRFAFQINKKSALISGLAAGIAITFLLITSASDFLYFNF